MSREGLSLYYYFLFVFLLTRDGWAERRGRGSVLRHRVGVACLSPAASPRRHGRSNQATLWLIAADFLITCCGYQWGGKPCTYVSNGNCCVLGVYRAQADWIKVITVNIIIIIIQMKCSAIDFRFPRVFTG